MNPFAPLYPPKASAPSSGSANAAAPNPLNSSLNNQSAPNFSNSPSVNPLMPNPSVSTAETNPPASPNLGAPVSSQPVPPTPQPTSPAAVSTTPSENITPANNPAPVGARPVMSAKAAINAMYAAEKNRPNAKLVPSAREAVNAASRVTQRNFKSASNLHHGSLQKVEKIPTPPKSMESTRTSASALLKTANSGSKDVPVVHTSLKLGSNSQSKNEAVILPAGSRMARVARPVANLSDDSAVMINSVPKRSLGSSNSGGLAVRVIPSNRSKLTALPRSQRGIRDPQMLSQGRRILPSKTPVSISPSGNRELASGTSTSVQINSINRSPLAPNSATLSNAPANRANTPTMVPSAAGASQTISINGVKSSKVNVNSDISPVRKLVRPRRFRTVPKNYAATEPAVIAADNAYAMSEPPKLAARHRGMPDPEDLGVVRNFRPTKLPEPIGDAAPIGRLASQRVASGHGGPAEAPAIKAENTSNYSFSRREDKAKPASYAPADKSPFLKSVNVEKRPLSDSAAPTPISLPRTPEAKPEKTSRKNSYQKRNSEPKAELPSRPTIVVPSNRRSKAPLFFLILFTIILGAAVGAAVYLCFFQ